MSGASAAETVLSTSPPATLTRPASTPYTSSGRSAGHSPSHSRARASLSARRAVPTDGGCCSTSAGAIASSPATASSITTADASGTGVGTRADATLGVRLRFAPAPPLSFPAVSSSQRVAFGCTRGFDTCPAVPPSMIAVPPWPGRRCSFRRPPRPATISPA